MTSRKATTTSPVHCVVMRDRWKTWSYRKMASVDVAWYRQHGKYPEDRIRRDSSGVEYVIGDWSWERKFPKRPEVIDRKMATNHEFVAASDTA